MKIEVLGPGCQRCEQLHANTLTAVANVSTAADIEVTKVKDMNYFVKMGVFTTPALVIDGKVVATGKLLSVPEIEQCIREHM